MNILEFIRPELLALVAVLYFIGVALKKAASVTDKYIPLTLGAFGMVLALLYVIGTSTNVLTTQDWFMAAFVSTVQGWLCAGMSVYVNQVLKQINKK